MKSEPKMVLRRIIMVLILFGIRTMLEMTRIDFGRSTGYHSGQHLNRYPSSPLDTVARVPEAPVIAIDVPVP